AARNRKNKTTERAEDRETSHTGRGGGTNGPDDGRGTARRKGREPDDSGVTGSARTTARATDAETTGKG
ncbi:hypothetical protein C3R44_21210, partial [Mycobacterium tuberculosis]